MRVRNGLILAFSFGLVTICGLLWRNHLENRRLQALLAAASREVVEGRFYLALDHLGELRKARPQWSEIAFWIGLAEQGRKKPLLALEAWKSVPISTEYGVRAANLRGRALMALGRFHEAEECLKLAAGQNSKDRSEAQRSLILLLRFQSRIEEIKAIELTILDDPETSITQGIEALRELWKLDHDPVPIDSIRDYLNEVGGPNPKDPKVRLALANLETRSGKLEEADRLLLSCEAIEPADEAVLQSRLAWSRMADRPDRATSVLKTLQGDRASYFDLRAWGARSREELANERQALEQRLEAAPSDLSAIERLAEIATLDHDLNEASRLRTIKDRRDQELSRYKALLFSEHPEAKFKELQTLAYQLKMAEWTHFWNAQSNQGQRSRRPELISLHDAIPDSTNSQDSSVAALSSRGQIAFLDDADKAGLAMVFEPGWSTQRQLPETMSGGLALLDYDLDGWLDVYALQGGAFPSGGGGDRLFRNKQDGTFEDVSVSSGIADLPKDYASGVSVGDIDNDGDPDLFLTRWRSYRLLSNQGNGRFIDITEASGLGGERGWPTSSAFADLDHDGDLDLYVCHYLDWSAENPKLCRDPETGRNFYCTPAESQSQADHLFRNDGGKFVDATESSGVLEREGRGLGVVTADLDDDGKIDIYVANDMSANLLFHNLGDFHFEEVGYQWGLATSGLGGVQAGMGIAFGDLDGDLLPDLIVTNFFNESSTLHQNLGHGLYTDHTSFSGLSALSRDFLGFGVAMADFDNDGLLDVVTANGHVNDGRPQYPWKMPAQIFQGVGKGKLIDASARAGEAFQVPQIGRGLAVGDMNHDGLVDVLMVSQHEPLVYLRNVTKPEQNHFLSIELRGTKSGTDAIGTKVVLKANGRSWASQKTGGGSYLSSSDPRLHFGIADAKVVESAEVRWISGTVQTFANLKTDRSYRFVEGESEAIERPQSPMNNMSNRNP